MKFVLRYCEYFCVEDQEEEIEEDYVYDAEGVRTAEVSSRF
jgi:hypothetical protein